MGVEKDRKTANRWLKQAEDDFETGTILINSGKFAQACFYFQQSAEKAIKSVWYLYGEEPWGQAISRFIEVLPVDELRDEFIKELLSEAKELDKLYIPTRYPNGLPEGLLPADAYTEKNAKDAKWMAKKIIDKVKGVIV